MTEELTAEERGWATTSAGYERKLLRLYDAALARAENWERQWDMLKVQHDEALARAEELQHCCDRACQSRSQLNRLDTSVEKALAFLDKTRAEIEAGKPEPSSALCLLWLSTCAVEQRNVLDERQTVSCCQAAMSAESALAEATALLAEISESSNTGRSWRGAIRPLLSRTPAPAAQCGHCEMPSDDHERGCPAPAAKAELERPHCGQHAGWRSDCEECALHVAVSAPTLLERIEAAMHPYAGTSGCWWAVNEVIRASKAPSNAAIDTDLQGLDPHTI